MPQSANIMGVWCLNRDPAPNFDLNATLASCPAGTEMAERYMAAVASIRHNSLFILTSFF
jgi:hypothetical protein